MAPRQISPRHGPDVVLPQSYNDLNFTQIQTRHHDKEPSVIILTLYRPKNYNAFTDKMRQELEAAYAMFDVDDRVKCIVFTGDGRMFCAGADLGIGFGDGANDLEAERVEDHRDGGGRVALSIFHCRKPTIGALQGSAVGIGVTMTLPMNIRIAYKSAKIGFVFGRRGIIMEACSSFFLPRLIGYSRAMAATTTGSTYLASDKIFDGLFTELCDKPEDVLPAALRVAEDVVRNTSSVSTYLMKELMFRDKGSPEGQHLLDSRIIFELFGSPDNEEGVQSFLQKRPAKFVGSMENTTVTGYPWWMPVDILGRPKVAPTGKAKI
ncbi:enoyl-CoA hydratase/isomeras-like protein [Cucurbitaria berberidis CBS 394.84]|uniref:Enoyl-CoA hydratase/isomeras-like protein n=1 Tax=Cucurbitaria berberidis CBS 394.84 TaxID=1168544 RepID=A0A9P4GUP0_9PLEO|nr:enoyl-CoA hydratase/isomeras-like protein [Cucurbitaria berberidis CBS 394.84]KAF1851604.1 enoyl-CoA hydratase/isomeras-like protein [Cucurbitaria berberidis CBS 394.84]